MILLTFRDLVYRKTRFIVVTLLGAVVFALAVRDDRPREPVQPRTG